MAQILLIDDNAALRTVLRNALIYFGHSVIEAADGHEGLELFAKTSVDLVITDLHMPGTAGMGVLVELRNQNTPVKVIVMSGKGGWGQGESFRLARLLGAAEILPKPFSLETLRSAVDRVVSCATVAA